jgi:hypothetical protein
LWNLQYNDEKQEGEVHGVSKTDENGVVFMSGPEGIDVTVPEVQTVLGADGNPEAVEPDGALRSTPSS